jgi:molecular chaperone GrpE
MVQHVPLLFLFKSDELLTQIYYFIAKLVRHLMKIFGTSLRRLMSKNKQVQESEEALPAEPSEEIDAIEPIVDDGEIVPSPEVGEVEEDELALAQAEISRLTDALQRERADFQNYRKRVERENELMRDQARLDVLIRFLPILDDFDRATELLGQEHTEATSDWLEGIRLIHKKLRNIMDAEGIVELYPLGEPFDPRYHEVVSMESTDEYTSEHVSYVLEKGYIKGDRVLRTAKVRVAN